MWTGLNSRTCGSSRLTNWCKGRRPLGAVLHSSREPNELSQWLRHSDSTINVVLVIRIIILLLIIIIIIIIIILLFNAKVAFSCGNNALKVSL